MSVGTPSFSIMFFSASEDSLRSDKYRLVLDAARFADEHDFEAVWVPERHFASLGGLYPNPSVLQAALAVATQHVGLRAGSVVLPIHDPIRVVEEWSMVDNLSGGRVGLSLASGWNPVDFAFFPDRYGDRHQALYRGLEEVRRLWRGGQTSVTSGTGELLEVKLFPRPVQPELPVWITAARSPETFTRAGEVGANVLTHLLDQDVEALGEKIELYREARRRGGHEPGRVTVMVHTFVGADAAATREAARAPYCAFLKSNVALLKGLAQSRGSQVDFDALSPSDQDNFVHFLYERFADSRALIGSPETCLPLIRGLAEAGADEVAALLDFGPSYDEVMAGLPYLDRLRSLSETELGPSRSRPALAPAALAVRTGSAAPGSESRVDLEAVRARAEEELSAPEVYARFREAGLEVDPALATVTRVWRREREALAELTTGGAPVEAQHGAPAALVEGAFQAAALACPPPLPIGLGYRRFAVLQAGRSPAWSHAVVRPHPCPAGDWEAEVTLLDEAGEALARFGGVQLRVLAEEEPTHEELQPGWYYELRWEGLGALVEPVSPPLQGWLLLADEGGLAAELAARLGELGQRVKLVSRAELLEEDGSGPSQARVEKLLEQYRSFDGVVCRGVVHCLGLDAAPEARTSSAQLMEDSRWGAGSALLALQSLISQGSAQWRPRLWLISSGAQPVGGEAELAIAQAPLWGLGRTAAMEHPEIWGGLVDLDPNLSRAEAASQLAAVLLDEDGEDQVALRGGTAHGARLVPVAPPERRPLVVRPEGTYLITGGLWGIGLEVARWLVAKGARDLVLLGRSELPPRETWASLTGDLAQRVAGLADLERQGARVAYGALDVADGAALTAFLEGLEATGWPPVKGVVHAASVWRDRQGASLIRTLPQLDLAALEQVFRPKVLGTWVLHEQFRGAELDFFLLFSSAATLTGSAGQGNYAAASLFLDALAHLRSRQGLPALAVNWGPVSGVGFGATEEGTKVHTYWESNGLGRIDPTQLLEALELLLPSPHAQRGVMRIDWQALARFFPALGQAAWASRLVVAAAPRGPSEVLQALLAAPVAARRDHLTRYVQEEVGRIMGLERLPDPRRKLFDMGLDSLMALELKNRLQANLDAEVQVTAVFNYPTIESLAGYLSEQVLGFEGQAPDAPALPVGEPAGGVSSLVAQMHELSDEEVERALAARGLAQEVAT